MRSASDDRLMQRGFLEDYNGNGPKRGTAPGDNRDDPTDPTGAGDATSTFSSELYQSADYSATKTPGAALEETGRQQPERYSWFVLLLTATSALGGFLFGYDTGVVSGAMLLIRQDFGLTDTQEEVVVSITIVAAVSAALAGGPGMEHFGRRPAILLAAVVFTIGAGLLAVANTYLQLVVGRFVVGVGIGLASLVTPVYIAEAAPSNVRGTLVTLNTLFITVGQVIAGVVDGLFASTDGGWRYMLGLSGVPSILMVVGFMFLPESPRWLVSAGKRREALAVLQKIRGLADVHTELDGMVESATDHAGGLKASVTVRGLLEDARIRRALVLGCGLQLLQQLSGINTVMYYSATIFSMAGFSDQVSIWLAAVTAASQSVGVCLGLYFIERCGRRTLVLSSLGMVACSLVCLGTGFHLYDGAESSSAAAERWAYVVVASMLIYLFTFGVGMSSVPWTVNAEIYPNHARSLGTSASTTVNWLGNVVVSATFLTLASSNALGKDGAFWLYASIAMAGWFWLYNCMPETKALSLEEIEILFVREGDALRPGEVRPSSPTEEGVVMGAAPRRAGGFAMLDGSGSGGSGHLSSRRRTGANAWADARNSGGSSSLA